VRIQINKKKKKREKKRKRINQYHNPTCLTTINAPTVIPRGFPNPIALDLLAFRFLDDILCDEYQTLANTRRAIRIGHVAKKSFNKNEQGTTSRIGMERERLKY
jgi:hypothetical protein